jgi:hypothetical protein
MSLIARRGSQSLAHQYDSACFRWTCREVCKADVCRVCALLRWDFKKRSKRCSRESVCSAETESRRDAKVPVATLSGERDDGRKG